MGGVRKFEDIKAWQKARGLNNKIYKISSKGKFFNDFPLRNQIRKASISIMLNIAEGFGRKRDREFGKFLTYSLGSSAEVQSALYIALDQKYISKKQFDGLYSLADEIYFMILSLYHYLLNNVENTKSVGPRT